MNMGFRFRKSVSFQALSEEEKSGITVTSPPTLPTVSTGEACIVIRPLMLFMKPGPLLMFFSWISGAR